MHLKDIAILYRLNWIGEFLEQRLLEAGFPVQRVGQKCFFEYPEIQESLKMFERWNLDERPFSEQLGDCVKPLFPEGSGENLRLLQLVTLATAFDGAAAPQARELFLEHAATTRDEDFWNPEREAITLMTMHAAKGLEYPVVFIAGLEEGILPFATEQGPSLQNNEEEERRLFFVALTRAKSNLYLSCSRQRQRFGKTIKAPASRFISEIPAALLRAQYIALSKRSIRTKYRKAQMEML